MQNDVKYRQRLFSYSLFNLTNFAVKKLPVSEIIIDVYLLFLYDDRYERKWK